MIRECRDSDVSSILAIVNDAAEAYRGVIPADCWQEPYMPEHELAEEIASGVEFLGFVDEPGVVVGVMGRQTVGDVCLIRHAYVATARQGLGIGTALLEEIRAAAEHPLLVGTWAAASWAIGFYQRNGFHLVTPAEKNRLLETYWSIGPRQIETSVVLAAGERRTQSWLAEHRG